MQVSDCRRSAVSSESGGVLPRVRRFGDGSIDYDFYHMRARKMRSRVFVDAIQKAARFIRPLIALAILVVAIWMLPSRSEDCAVCTPGAGVSRGPATR